MHPAPSVIIFTVFSGLGFGMLAWMGFGYPDVTGWNAFGYFFIAYAMAVGGLVSSTFHLGNPKNAMKAFSQWRTSWLSREAWMAVISLSVLGLFAAAAVFMDVSIPPIGWVGAVLAMITVYTTSMMYAQLKTVPRWNHPSTSLLFLLYALSGGAIMTGQNFYAGILLVVTGLVQLFVWVAGDSRFGDRGHTMETATGLGMIGKVRMYEPPHSGTNYLLDEMVYVIGRKHAQKLRSIAFVLGFVIPALVLLAFPSTYVVSIVALLSHIAGVLTQRWLFFAEAEHVVGLYYDKR
jgi:DMSO reductase anchor subunit